jgi:TPR repeat protein
LPADIKAVEQYSAGCERDDWNSCYKLADAYARGRGVQKNLGSAARLYHKVCDHPEGAGCEDLKKLLCQTNSLTDCP